MDLLFVASDSMKKEDLEEHDLKMDLDGVAQIAETMTEGALGTVKVAAISTEEAMAGTEMITLALRDEEARRTTTMVLLEVVRTKVVHLDPRAAVRSPTTDLVMEGGVVSHVMGALTINVDGTKIEEDRHQVPRWSPTWSVRLHRNIGNSNLRTRFSANADTMILQRNHLVKRVEATASSRPQAVLATKSPQLERCLALGLKGRVFCVFVVL
mmetsp:Transcript_18911/g.40690  ORF Transcript_18911/g.40690 Transcript_18911/m.40690 type:complete len:212 (+) Transcript_18911:2276-2911(+)